MAHINQNTKKELAARPCPKVFDLHDAHSMIALSRIMTVQRILAFPVMKKGKFDNAKWYREFMRDLKTQEI